MRLFRLLRVLRVIRTARILPVKFGEISMRLISLCLTMVILILLAAGIFYELEASDGFGGGDASLQFHDSIYWAAVTLSTVGYGDIHPTNWQTQLLFIILMLLLVTLVPYQSSALIEAVLDYSHYQRASYARKPLQSHVIITGQFDHITLETVLTELFHEDNGQRQFDAVVLSPKTPTSQMKLLVASHIHGPVQAQYIQGSPLNPKVWHCASLVHVCNCGCGCRYAPPAQAAGSSDLCDAMASLEVHTCPSCHPLPPLPPPCRTSSAARRSTRTPSSS